jgi:alpha-beta hydrolase superfamily lysophospholipase
MIGRYRWRGGEEHYLRLGEDAPVTLLVLPALFEEANRMRRFTVSLMRALADGGIGTVLPDLPGTGESTSEIADVTFAQWSEAINSVADTVSKPLKTVAFRGGALLDGAATAGWRLAPESGERLLRDMVRATALSQGVSASELDKTARIAPTRLAGNIIAPHFYSALADAAPLQGRYRTARLEDDVAERDVTLTGSKLWRAAEPGEDAALVAAAAADIADWIATCGA